MADFNHSFPHLNDTQFPLINNVDVYEYENDFDYSRWTDITKIHLGNVLFNSDYRNVVKFESDEARDSYFDKSNEFTIEMRTAFHVAPDNTVKIPVPYQVASRYNYLWVDLPTMTNPENPINYETERRVHRYYYFIEDVTQLAPSSTLVLVKMDNWTTFINNVDIPYMVLERGHAPMTMTSVETYLDNPIENTKYIQAPDVDFATGNGIVKTSDFVPINNGEKYTLISLTMSVEQIKAIQYPAYIPSATTTPATFADADMRNGYQYIVNDYVWDIGEYDYSGIEVESFPYQSVDGNIPNGSVVIACKSTDANRMFEYMSNVASYLFKNITACFIVSEDMFEKGDNITFCNVNCYIAIPQDDKILYSLRLNKDMFGFDEKYSDITKLYTYPYSSIEVTDNNGNKNEIRIENTSKVDIHNITSIAFPYIKAIVYMTGINGSNSYNAYNWTNLLGDTEQLKMFCDDFGDYLWKWDIPTYALHVKAYDVYKAENYPRQAMNRYNAIAEYHKTVGMANTQYENSKDAADNTKTMTNNSAATENTNALAQATVINDNATRSANTGYTNEVASATTARDNAYRSGDTNETNADNNAQTMRDNNELNCELNSYVTEQNNTQSLDVLSWNNSLSRQLNSNTNNLTQQSTDINNSYQATMGIANMTAGAVKQAGNIVSETFSHAGIMNVPGAVGSIIGGVANGGADVVYAGTSTYYSISRDSLLADATVANNNRTTNNTIETNNGVNYLARTFATRITDETNDTNTATTDNSATTMETNADNTNNTVHANALATYNTSVANAGRTRDTSITNADDTENVSKANANRTKANTDNNALLNRNVTVANSGYTRGTTVDNAKITLEQRRLENQQAYNSYKLNSPVQYGQSSGDATLDVIKKRGVQIKIRTENDGDIAQAGDLMLRYGYALNQVWNVSESGLNLMKYFTYWKAPDMFINEGSGVNQGAQKDIQSAFENGVTVWSDPDLIGKVSIYDNWK